MSCLTLCAKGKQVGFKDPYLRKIIEFLDVHKNIGSERSVEVQLDMNATTFLLFSYSNYKVKRHEINVYSCADQIHYLVKVSFRPLDPKAAEARDCKYWVRREDVFSFVAFYATLCLWDLMKVTAVKMVDETFIV